MNPEQYMILIDGADKTREIESVDYDPAENRMAVKYYKSSKIYKYRCDRVQKFDELKEIDLKDKVDYILEYTIYEPEKILDFGEKMKIIVYKGRERVVDAKDFSIIETGVKNDKTESIIDYFKDISQYTSDKNEDEAYLKREMKRLTFVHPESVLNTYLKQSRIKNRDGDENYIYPFRFNLSQKEALENAMKSSISIIEGPPGTGKTQTILNIIANLIIRGKSIAVVSNNNDAVKNIIDKLEKENYGFLPAMLGKKCNKENFFDNMPEAEVSGWDYEENTDDLKREIKDINKNLNNLLKTERRRAKLKQEISDWKLEQSHFEEYYGVQDINYDQKFPMFMSDPDRIIDFMAEMSLADEYEIYGKLLYKIKLFFKYRIWDIKKLNDLDAALFLMLQKKFYDVQIARLEKQIELCENELKDNDFDYLIDQHQHISEILFKKYLYERYIDIEKPAYKENNFKMNFQNFIRHFPIILSTTYSLRNSIPENYLLDYLIIDESSQVDLITGTLAFSACKNVIIVGDTKQLPQITKKNIKNKLSTKLPGKAYDYFEHNILTSIIDIYGENIPRVILKEHYRCHPKIIEFCNRKYYNGELIAYTNENMSDCPLMIYKTAEGNHMRKVTQGEEKGTYNQRELDTIFEKILADKAKDCDEHGIVTPYRKQADKAEAMTDSSVQSDTVHKYQGREKDVIIMSTVLSETSSKYDLNFVDDEQMINVAVSRAKKQFILVTDKNLFYKKGNNIGDLIRYIEYSTLDDNVIESQIVSVFDLLYRKYSDKLIKYKKKMDSSAKFKSEEALRVLLEEILSEGRFTRFTYVQEVRMKNLLRNISKLTDSEKAFVNSKSAVDFVIYYKMDKTCVFVIEVDGFAFHENNPQQLQRDRMKDRILSKYNIPILRLATNGSGEKEKIEKMLEKAMCSIR